MNQTIKKWAFRLGVTLVFIVAILIIIVLNPRLTYANETVLDIHTVYHQKPLDPVFRNRLKAATALVSRSEYYKPGIALDICLNDGAQYPAFMQALRGRAFAWGFYNKVVLMGEANYRLNHVELNAYKWNMEQLLAHEMIHCFQFYERGLFKSNPLAKIPEWKWEGYPEYISRQQPDQQDLQFNIKRLLEVEKMDNNGWIEFADGTGVVIPYYKYWLLVQFCIDIKKMTYQDILQDSTSDELIQREMADWYNRSKK